ncbi:IS1/IS1595 family N-terminal zinc-binding domain-containing protein [Testudinibacter sp. P80/BLE/0925]
MLFCSSYTYHKYGFKAEIQRYKCNDCQRIFTFYYLQRMAWIIERYF